MKTLFKLILTALVLFACWRGGAAFWRFYQLQDEVQKLVQFAGGSSDSTLQSRASEAAAKLGIAIDPEKVIVQRPEGHVVVEVDYTDEIEWIPTRRFPRQFKAVGDALVFTVAH